MKTSKTLIALSIALASSSAFASTGHIGNQSGNDNTFDAQIGSIENVMGGVCVQSGDNNNCSVDVENVSGDLNIAAGANVTVVQGGSSNVDAGGSMINDNAIAISTADRTVGTGVFQAIGTDGTIKTTVYEAGDKTAELTVELASDQELRTVKNELSQEISNVAFQNFMRDEQLQAQIDAIDFVDTDTVRSDAEIKAIADVGDKILANEIDELRDMTTAQHNAQSKALGVQWEMHQDNLAVDADQQAQLDQKVNRDEFLASQAAQDAELELVKGDVINAQATADSALTAAQVADAKAENNASQIASQQEQLNQTADRVTSVEGSVAALDGRVVAVESELQNKVDSSEFYADQQRQDEALANAVIESEFRDAELANAITGVDAKVDGVQDQVNALDGRVTDVEQVANAAMDQAISAQLTGEYAQELAYGALEGVENNAAEIARVESESLERDNKIVADSIARDNNLMEAIDDTHEKSMERDAAIVDYVVADQERQDKVIAQNDAESKARDEALAAGVSANGQKIATVEKKADANAKAIVKADTESKARDEAIVANQAKVDAKQDKVFNDYRVVQEQVDAGQYASIDELYNATGDLYKTQAEHSVQIAGLNSRVSDLENSVKGLKKDVTRLDGMVAANLAAASMETPIDWNGDLAVQVGVGHYNGQNALALGIMGGNEHVVLKATVAATDADNWNNVAAAASATFSTGLLK